jgi:hypothetical protein
MEVQIFHAINKHTRIDEIVAKVRFLRPEAYEIGWVLLRAVSG